MKEVQYTPQIASCPFCGGKIVVMSDGTSHCEKCRAKRTVVQGTKRIELLSRWEK